MKVSANIPLRDGVFEGVLLVLKPGVTLSFFHCDYRELASQAIEETHVSTGTIPVVVHDDQNNFAAFRLEVKNGSWKCTTLEGYTNEKGQWTSGLIDQPTQRSGQAEARR